MRFEWLLPSGAINKGGKRPRRASRLLQDAVKPPTPAIGSCGCSSFSERSEWLVARERIAAQVSLDRSGRPSSIFWVDWRVMAEPDPQVTPVSGRFVKRLRETE